MVTGKPGLKKLVYAFSEGDASMTDLLGGKGSNLCEMFRLGLPVPPGFVISTETCLEYFNLGNRLPDGLTDSIRGSVGQIEEAMGRKFGSLERPLLVSVRSGARVSMPGMMDTILNLGINDAIAQGLAEEMGDLRTALDAHRRFLQIYADVVMEVEPGVFEEILTLHKDRDRVTEDHQLAPDTLHNVISDYKSAIRRATGADIPNDPWDQLIHATEAVFRSWNNPRATFYRNHNGIDHAMGTVVTIMSMVYGNLGPTGGTGVLFTRNPATGERKVYGEFLSNAQGEDVVAGVRTPQPIAALADVMPEASRQLMDLAAQLETHYHHAQDIEFTIENGRLFILQTRNAKRIPPAAVKIAVDMVAEGAISREEALLQVSEARRVRFCLGWGVFIDRIQATASLDPRAIPGPIIRRI